MKKSILTRLIGGSLLLSIAIVLLGVYFAVGTRVDRAVTEDARRLGEIQDRLQLIVLRAAMLGFDATPDLVRSHARQMREADTDLLRLVAERPSTVEG